MMKLPAPIHLLQTIHGFIILHNIPFPGWSCPILSPYLEAFLWFLLRDVRSRLSPAAPVQDSSCLTTGSQPSMPKDPEFLPGFARSTSSKGEHIPQTHTHTHAHPTGLLINAHKWHSLESHTHTHRFTGSLNTSTDPLAA